MNSRYKELSTAARNFEINGAFSRASTYWDRAAKVARKPDNISYCKARAQYCKERKH